MLLRVLLLLAFVTALVQAIMLATASLAHATIAHRAADLANRATLTATTRAQTALAAAVAADPGASTVPGLSPIPIATCAPLGTSACAFRAIGVVTFVTPGAAPSPAGSACPDRGCASYWQENDLVAEGRGDATISTIVTGPTGAILARRNAEVRFRTLAVPPYAVLAGSLDLRGDGLAGNGAGDDAGSIGTANGGTLIDVVYQNARTNARIPANVWRAQSYDVAPAALPWDP